jgi:hypothetical protein
MEKELPSIIIKRYLQGQERIKPRATPRTTEELLYRQRLQEKLKPPSVKMAEAEERLRKEEERIREAARKEARMEEIAIATKALPGLMEEMAKKEGVSEQPPSYETLLTPAERQRGFVPEERTIEKELSDASKTQTLSKNLNNLFNTPRNKTTTGIKVVNKLSADGLRKALKNADDNGRVLDGEFKKAIRNIIRLKVSGSSKA